MTCRGLIAPSLALLTVAGSAFGQGSVYEAHAGTGSFDLGNQSTNALRVPLSFRLREREVHGWGLRLRVPVTLGVTSFDDNVTLDSLKTVSVVPTAWFEFPVNETWTFIPFTGLGASHEFESSSTEWLGVLGTQMRADRAWNANRLTFAAGLRYAWQMSSDGLNFDDFGRTEFGLDLYRRLGANVSGKHFTPGLYSRAFLYWDDVQVSTEQGTVATIDDEYELGLSLGTAPSIEVFGIGLPRTFLGYRFGGGLSGVRLTFGEIL